MPEEKDSSYDIVPPQPAPAPPPRADIVGAGGGAYDTVEPVEAPRPATTVTTVAPEVVEERLCPHCGFRIVGRVKRARCPDCAAALDEVAVDLLQFSPAGWVRTMGGGAFLMAIGLVGFVIAVVFSWSGREPYDKWAYMAAPCVVLAAVWLLTRADPEDKGASPTRIASRVMSLVAGASWIVPIALNVHGKATLPWLYLSLVLSAGQALCVGLHMRTLAVRVPSDSLAAQALNLAGLVAFVCLFLIGLQATGAAERVNLRLGFFCAFPMIGGLLAVLGWAIVFCLMLGLQLFAAAAAGRDIAYRKAQRQMQMAKKTAAAAGSGGTAKAG